jgi:hypothetical protein
VSDPTEQRWELCTRDDCPIPVSEHQGVGTRFTQHPASPSVAVPTPTPGPDMIVNRWGEPEYLDRDDEATYLAAFRAPRNKITENLAAAELRGWKDAMEAINAYASNKLDRYERLETGEAAAGAYSDISTVANLAHQYPERAKAEIFAKYHASPIGLADEIERTP